MSIFDKKPLPPPPSEKRFADIELSISNRYKSLDDKMDSRFDALEKQLMQYKQQNTELLKVHYDTQRQVSNQIIDVENAAKKEFYNYEIKLDQKLDSLDKIYATNEKVTEVGSQVVSAVKKIDKDINEQRARVDNVNSKIPQNTVDKKTFEEAYASLNNAIMKVANAIPKNTVSRVELARLEDQIKRMFDFYTTVDTLKSVESDFKTKIIKIAKTSADTSNLSKNTQKEVNKLASTVKEIKADYTPKAIIPSVNKTIEETKAELLKNDEAVRNDIPTNFVTTTELENTQSSISNVNNELLKTKNMLNESINISQSQIDKMVKDAISYFDNKVKELEVAFSDKSGIDSERMKNIIREVADEEIKLLRNTTKLLQDNVKQNVIEVKNQNKNLANKFNELQKDFFKVLKLTNITK